MKRSYTEKSPHSDFTFSTKGAQPVEHRDTGENAGALPADFTYRIHPTELRDCSDLLREWGVGRGDA